MNLIGRWERVRELRAGQWGLPYMLDRKWARLLPAAGPEWWRSPDGIWTPTLRGGALGLATAPFQIGPRVLNHSQQSINGEHALNATGNEVGARVALPRDVTLTSLHFCLNSYGGGTNSNVNDLNWAVYNASSNVNLPDVGGGALASGTVNPSSATGWIHVTGISQALTAGVYWVAISDADASGTDYARIGVAWNQNDDNMSEVIALWLQASTTNNWSTMSAYAAGPAILVLGFDDGSAMGVPFLSEDAFSSNTLERGVYLANGHGVTGDVDVWAINGAVASGGCSGVKLYDGATAPGGSTLGAASGAASVFGSNQNPTAKTGAMFSTPVTIATATAFRAIFTIGSAATSPWRGYLGSSGAGNAVLQAVLDGWQATVDNAGGGWTNDANRMPRVTLYVTDVAEGGGGPGGSLGLGIRPNMSGGLL